MKIMNYQFITGNLQRIQWHKMQLFFFLMLYIPSQAQTILPDSIMIHKSWNDKNGKNKLTVKVNALCNPNRPPFDGHETKIEAEIRNAGGSQEIVYNDEDYQMEMILFRENDIWLEEFNKIKAVFIPFFYCGNSDSDIKASFIIFYNTKKYLYHINFHCTENGTCKVTDDLNTKLKELSPKLRNSFIKSLKSKYKKYSDFN